MQNPLEIWEHFCSFRIHEINVRNSARDVSGPLPVGTDAPGCLSWSPACWGTVAGDDSGRQDPAGGWQDFRHELYKSCMPLPGADHINKNLFENSGSEGPKK